MIHADALSGLAYRFRLIVDGLRKTVPEHQTKNPASCALVGVIWTSLGRRMERFGRILARVEAGIPDPVWPSRAGRRVAPREADCGGDGAEVAVGKPARPRMPTRAGWLMIMMPWVVAPYGTQLRHWLTDPDAEALVRSSRQMRRLLRPLLRSLSTDPLPECLLEPTAVDAAGSVGKSSGAMGGESEPEAAADLVEREAAVAVRRGTRRAGRRGAARAARHVADKPRAALPDTTDRKTAGSVKLPEYASVSAAVASPPVEWWRVQDERRRAALAIARGSVCRG